MSYIAKFRAAIAATILLGSGQTALADTSANSLKAQYQRPDNIPFPADNLYSAEKAQLGKMLFFDQRLSKNFNMTCATCHNPSLGWEDGVPGAFGGQGKFLDRHSPTILNMAWSDSFFWDGRSPTLEDQIRGPVESPNEMNISMDEVVERLSKVKGYQEMFQRVFPGAGITGDGIMKAIATYERTLVSGTAPFDRWVMGDEQAISESAKRGFEFFNNGAGCSECHTGWNFSDNKFYDIGLSSADEGRMTVTGNAADKHAFKTPGLRNIQQRAPYMHDGSMKTLDEVIIHYIAGGTPRPSRSDKMTVRPMTPQQITDLRSFLESLTGEDQPVSLPILPY